MEDKERGMNEGERNAIKNNIMSGTSPVLFATLSRLFLSLLSLSSDSPSKRMMMPSHHHPSLDSSLDRKEG